jgi:hypothetical protein
MHIAPYLQSAVLIIGSRETGTGSRPLFLISRFWFVACGLITYNDPAHHCPPPAPQEAAQVITDGRRRRTRRCLYSSPAVVRRAANPQPTGCIWAGAWGTTSQLKFLGGHILRSGRPISHTKPSGITHQTPKRKEEVENKSIFRPF